MIFEKKVIIGSIMSFIATVVGVVAVFFPNLLNLQKEKIASFSSSINSKKEAQKLVSFLDKMAKEKKIFKLDIMICIKNTNMKEYSILDNFLIVSDHSDFNNGPEGPKSKYHYTLIEAITPFDSISSDEEFKNCFDSNSGYYHSAGCGGKEYHFQTEEFESVYWIDDFYRTSYNGDNFCDNSHTRHTGLAIAGYYIASKFREWKGAQINRFSAISSQQLRLKDY